MPRQKPCAILKNLANIAKNLAILIVETWPFAPNWRLLGQQLCISIHFNFIQTWPKFVKEKTCVKCVKTCDWLVNFLKPWANDTRSETCRHNVVRNRTWSDSQRLGRCQDSDSLFDEFTRKPVQINTAGSPNGFKLEQAQLVPLPTNFTQPFFFEPFWTYP